eukprot:2117718-Lingulodinium_polyedra.AAC.1
MFMRARWKRVFGALACLRGSCCARAPQTVRHHERLRSTNLMQISPNACVHRTRRQFRAQCTQP